MELILNMTVTDIIIFFPFWINLLIISSINWLFMQDLNSASGEKCHHNYPEPKMTPSHSFFNLFFCPTNTSKLQIMGCCLAQWVQQVSHVQRLCPRCSVRVPAWGPLLRITPPLCQPVSCHVFNYPVKKAKRPKKIYLKKNPKNLKIIE